MSDEKYVVFNFVDKEIALMKEEPTNVKKILNVDGKMTAAELREATVDCDTILEDVMLSIVTYRLKMEQLIGAAEVDCISEAVRNIKWMSSKKGNEYTLVAAIGQDLKELNGACEGYLRSTTNQNCWESFAGSSADAKATSDEWQTDKSNAAINIGWGVVHVNYTDTSVYFSEIKTDLDALQEQINQGLEVDVTNLDYSINSMQRKIDALQEELERVKSLGNKDE